MNSDNKQSQKAPDDLIYQQVDLFNRQCLIKEAEKTLKEANDVEQKQMSLKEEIEKYRESFRNFYYTSHVLTDSKNNQFFQQTIKEVHSGIKLKTPAKNILRLVNKVFLQELAQVCFQILQKTGGEDVTQQVVEDAYRLMQKRRAKHNKFGKLFSSS